MCPALLGGCGGIQEPCSGEEGVGDVGADSSSSSSRRRSRSSIAGG
jgi:hypothetical protein